MTFRAIDPATGDSREFDLQFRLDWWRGGSRMSKGPWLSYEEVQEGILRVLDDFVCGPPDGKELHVLARRVDKEKVS